MRGTLVSAWSYSWLDVWLPLRDFEQAPNELLPDLVSEFQKALPEPEPRIVIDETDTTHQMSNPGADFLAATTNRKLAEDFIRNTKGEEFRSERHLIRFFEEAFFLVDEYGIRELTDYYASLVCNFVDRYNLRYRVLDPFQIVPYMPALFSDLVERVRVSASQDDDLQELMVSAEQAFEDLTLRTRPADIKTCIAKVCSLAEGLAIRFPGVTEETLGKATSEIDCWPHATIKNALSALYGFCSNYPAIRHAGKPKSKIRELELRDAVIVSMLFFGFAGYLTDIDYSEVLSTKGSI